MFKCMQRVFLANSVIESIPETLWNSSFQPMHDIGGALYIIIVVLFERL